MHTHTNCGVRLRWVIAVVAACGAPNFGQVESTGFEASDGWVAGHSICGPEFEATCSYPVTDVCVPGDHAANQNCCSLDPNVATGWTMSDTSPHCLEPHIETANPYSGFQHLRFGWDPTLRFGSSAPASAIVTFPLIPEPRRTLISFRMAGASPPWSDLRFLARRDRYSFQQIGADIVFRSNGTIRIYDPTIFATAEAGTWVPGGGYKEVVVDLDPCNSLARYFYDGALIHSAPYGQDRAKEVGTLIFESGNTPLTWDVDDVSVAYAGDSCGISCSAGQVPACGPGPCVSIKAVAVNGNPITPTNCIHVFAGDLIETELFVSGWGTELPGGLRFYELKLLLSEGAISGSNGLVLPLGWDAPLYPNAYVPCSTSAMCPSEFPVCSSPWPGGHCLGLGHDPEQGAFIDQSRTDFPFFGSPGVYLLDVSSLNYRFLGIKEEPSGVVDAGEAKYLGNLVFRATLDAVGDFTIRFDTEEEYTYTLIGDALPKPTIVYADSAALVIRVCEDDKVFCNGTTWYDSVSGCQVTPPPECNDGNDCTVDSCNEDNDSCDHVATCGACCDAWVGACSDGVAPEECVCQSCIWTGGAECADVACEAEFVVIPAVSEWGLVVLALALLIGAKVRFGRGPESSAGVVG